MIYLKKNGSVYLYRAGLHSIEGKVGEPKYLEESIPLERAEVHRAFGYVAKDIGNLLKTLEPKFLNREILSMYQVCQKEIILISPFVSLEILDKFHHFGRFLDRAIEENAEVSLITRPPDPKDLLKYQHLDERCIFVYFLENLHTKLYIFDINPEDLPEYCRDMVSTAILGSSNLTKPGLSLDDERSSEELCYKLPIEKFSEAYSYAKGLIRKADDFKKHALRIKRS